MLDQQGPRRDDDPVVQAVLVVGPLGRRCFLQGVVGPRWIELREEQRSRRFDCECEHKQLSVDTRGLVNGCT